jgi:diaminopimelate epimerase
MHGCGNDYVFLDCFSNRVPEDPSRLAVSISDRNRGVGGDGLVLMLPAETPDTVARMRMFNADGSEGSLCGNALRCMAMWLHQSQNMGSEFRIAMGDRLINVFVVDSDAQIRSANIRIEIGQPVIQSPSANGRAMFVRSVDLPDLHLPSLIAAPIFVSMGNPHTILFVRSLDSVDFFKLGPLIEHHPEFPNRTNVEFVEIQPLSGTESIAKVRVWERGSGETMACGSGACAVTVAGIATGLLPDHATATTIAMRGGNLRILWDRSHSVFLEGPAVESFRGVFVDSGDENMLTTAKDCLAK